MKSNLLKVVVSAIVLISSYVIPKQANAACDRPILSIFQWVEEY